MLSVPEIAAAGVSKWRHWVSSVEKLPGFKPWPPILRQLCAWVQPMELLSNQLLLLRDEGFDQHSDQT